ncbi:hypothetical protein B0H14DRAFT_2639054 [Mycena olivaceomarginata]|nr:hypothetical protein B0H14DRAFT_2639054 [Mycena olivaceomarginata]
MDPLPLDLPSLTEHYLDLDQFQFVPGIRELIGKGSMIPGSIKSTADYSYSALRYSRDHFRFIGDAANFVDPFSLLGRTLCGLTICATINGQTIEAMAQEWHDSKVGIAHTRFLFVVLGAYQQMHLQQFPVRTPWM